MVCQAISTKTGEVAAVKKLTHVDEASRKRIADEVATMVRLNHPNIVSVYTVEHTDNCTMIVMENMAGGSLKSFLNKHTRLPYIIVRKYTTDMLEGLRYLHNEGFIHRDIKPGNALLNTDGTVKLADFGAAIEVCPILLGGVVLEIKGHGFVVSAMRKRFMQHEG